MSYDKVVADEIIARIAEGEPLRQILRSDPGRFPRKSAWYNWCEADTELDRRFKAARDDGHDAIAERAMETARGRGDSSGDVQRDKLIIDTDLKLLAKWDPRRYGDKVAMEHSGPGGGPVQTVTRIERRIVKPE
ncbi:hypothetical protein CSC62_05430 [Pseudoxanthomonas jiangsuensis]|uniref:terminase small subunit-like protein n=1 Tax=Pseudoxanthomonas jiangsuensis TaxID=619688 RepID=UPI001391AFD8|nr:hypothetical protein [Pseudoxanthomonas jiangsuensis]KAF1698351.1 hypothetical protein CSC62_05430 [Pseudoxanthomonas jiangsuensis]